MIFGWHCLAIAMCVTENGATQYRYREEKTMTGKLQRRLDAYKHELNSRIGFDNRRRWTQRVLADIEKSALTGKEKVMFRNAIIKAYEQI